MEMCLLISNLILDLTIVALHLIHTVNDCLKNKKADILFNQLYFTVNQAVELTAHSELSDIILLQSSC